MATLIAEIASYSVLFAHGNTPNQLPYRNRFIHLHLAPNADNLQLYILSFVPEARNASTGKLEKLPDSTYRGGTTIPIDEFSAYYELLRTEKPISIRIRSNDLMPPAKRTLSLDTTIPDWETLS